MFEPMRIDDCDVEVGETHSETYMIVLGSPDQYGNAALVYLSQA